jgi:hypothetical protein
MFCFDRSGHSRMHVFYDTDYNFDLFGKESERNKDKTFGNLTKCKAGKGGLWLISTTPIHSTIG